MSSSWPAQRQADPLSVLGKVTWSFSFLFVIPSRAGGASGLSISHSTTSGNTLERELPSTLPGSVLDLYPGQNWSKLSWQDFTLAGSFLLPWWDFWFHLRPPNYHHYYYHYYHIIIIIIIGGTPGFPLRPPHPRPKRERPGSVQRRGKKVGVLQNILIEKINTKSNIYKEGLLYKSFEFMLCASLSK